MLTIATKGSIKLREDQYVFPPRAQEAIPLSETQIFADMGWTAQLKYNDGRCLIKYKNGEIELWNRHAERFRTYRAPDELIDQLAEVRDRLNLSKTETSLLDGGLMHDKHCALHNTIVIWDVLAINGEHLIGSTYGDRHAHLVSKLSTQESWNFTNKAGTFDFGMKVSQDVLMPRCYAAADWQTTWDSLVLKVNSAYPKNSPLLEGFLLKDPEGKLKLGYGERNNDHWQCRSRVCTGRHRF